MNTDRRTARGAGFLALLAAAAVAGAGCAGAGRRTDETERLESLKREGRNASITILPVVLAGRPAEPVAEALGMYLERCGMSNLEVGAAPFSPAADGDPDRTAAALGQFVAANPVRTGFALYAEFRGTPGKRVEEVRAVLVNRSGQLVWQDRRTGADADFARMRPAEPMQCVVLLADRLRPVLSLGDPSAVGTPEGRLAKRWSEKTGLPSDAERKGMAARAERFRASAAGASLLVFPVLVNDRASAEVGAALAKAIGAAGLARTTAAPEPPRIEVQGAMNEQKVLWDLAGAFRQHMRTSRPDADYAICAQYLLGPAGVGAVHFVVCDRAGEWVLVDFQNSHHPDFNRVSPRSEGDCGRLVVKRLEGYLR